MMMMMMMMMKEDRVRLASFQDVHWYPNCFVTRHEEDGTKKDRIMDDQSYQLLFRSSSFWILSLERILGRVSATVAATAAAPAAVVASRQKARCWEMDPHHHLAVCLLNPKVHSHLSSPKIKIKRSARERERKKERKKDQVKLTEERERSGRKLCSLHLLKLR